MPETAQRSFLVSVAGIDGYFATITGGNSPATVSQAWNGGDLTPAQVAGPPVPENVTVGKPFKPERDAEIIKRLRQLISQWRTTVSKQPTDASLIPLGPATVYPEALLIDVQEAEADAGSGDPARWSLVFAISTIA